MLHDALRRQGDASVYTTEIACQSLIGSLGAARLAVAQHPQFEAPTRAAMAAVYRALTTLAERLAGAGGGDDEQRVRP